MEGKERKEDKGKLDGGREQVKKGLGEVYKTDEEGRRESQGCCFLTYYPFMAMLVH